MANEFAPIMFSLLEHVIPNSVYNIFVEGLNKRLNTDCADVPCIATEAANQGMSIQQVMAMPEQDGWIYTGLPNDGMAFVCSAYSASIYKAAGMFDDYDVNATEFTPRDVYMLDFFNTTQVRPAACVEADPNLPYCQLLGKYRIDVSHEWSTIAPYEHMNENCSSINPLYIRPEGC